MSLVMCCRGAMLKQGRAFGVVLSIILFSSVSAADSLPLSARAAVLMDADTGEVLYAKEPNLRLPPASLTKIVTALVALDHLDLNAKVAVSAGAADTVPSRIGLQAGERLYVQDLLYGLLLKSGNDAAEAIAEAVAGSVGRFAGLMNAKALLLGAYSSHFSNPHGLNADAHYSSAFDMALIFRQAMRNPIFAEIVVTRNALLRVESDAPYSAVRLVKVSNSNRLLQSYYGARGGKTGYTRAARLCFVGEARRGQQRLIAVVLGSESNDARWRDVETLFDYGFGLRDLPFTAGQEAPSKNNNPS